MAAVAFYKKISMGYNNTIGYARALEIEKLLGS